MEVGTVIKTAMFAHTCGLMEDGAPITFTRICMIAVPMPAAEILTPTNVLNCTAVALYAPWPKTQYLFKKYACVITIAYVIMEKTTTSLPRVIPVANISALNIAKLRSVLLPPTTRYRTNSLTYGLPSVRVRTYKRTRSANILTLSRPTETEELPLFTQCTGMSAILKRAACARYNISTSKQKS